MDAQSPIGVFDSGVGGIGILKDLIKGLPGEDFIYYGDSGNAPYGTRTEEQIRALSFECIRFLTDKGVKAVVIACNTASSAAVAQAREEFKIPIVAIEPAIRPAASIAGEGRVLTLATEATLKQGLFLDRMEECGIKERTIKVPAPALVELVEQGQAGTGEVYNEIRRLLMPYKDEDVRAIVIGCTHYLHIRKAVCETAESIWPGVKVLDGNQGILRQLERVLTHNGIRNPRTSGGRVELFTSGDPDIFLPVYRGFL